MYNLKKMIKFISNSKNTEWHRHCTTERRADRLGQATLHDSQHLHPLVLGDFQGVEVLQISWGCEWLRSKAPHNAQNKCPKQNAIPETPDNLKYVESLPRLWSNLLRVCPSSILNGRSVCVKPSILILFDGESRASIFVDGAKLM